MPLTDLPEFENIEKEIISLMEEQYILYHEIDDGIFYKILIPHPTLAVFWAEFDLKNIWQ